MLLRTEAPSELEDLIICLIQKRAGGTRPIALISSCVRVLNRWMRRAYGETWRRNNTRSYVHGSKEGSVASMRCKLAAAAEYARATNQSIVSVMLDLEKAFEKIPHDVLRAAAQAHGFSLAILRWLLHLYRMPRSIRVGKVYTESVVATRSILPGDAFADLLLFLAIVPAIDRLKENHPEAVIGVIADDVQIAMVGKHDDIATQLSTATALVIADFESEGMTVATKPGKLVMLTNLWKERELFIKKLKTKVSQACGRDIAAKIGVACFVKSARYLGADLSFSGRRAVAVQKTRLKEAQKRARRLRVIRAAGVSGDSVAATASAGLVKCATYAVAVNGVSDAQIHDTRSAMHASMCPRPAGRSLTADVQLTGKQAHGVDPGIDMASSPIVAWTTAWWEEWIPREWMRVIMRAARKIRAPHLE